MEYGMAGGMAGGMNAYQAHIKVEERGEDVSPVKLDKACRHQEHARWRWIGDRHFGETPQSYPHNSSRRVCTDTLGRLPKVSVKVF